MMMFGVLSHCNFKATTLVLLVVAGLTDAKVTNNSNKKIKIRGERHLQTTTASLSYDDGVPQKVSRKEGVPVKISKLKTTNLKELNFGELRLQLDEEDTELVLKEMDFTTMKKEDYYQDKDYPGYDEKPDKDQPEGYDEKPDKDQPEGYDEKPDKDQPEGYDEKPDKDQPEGYDKKPDKDWFRSEGGEEMEDRDTYVQINSGMEAWYGREQDGPAFAVLARNRSSGFLSGTVQTTDKMYTVSSRSDGSVFCSAASMADIANQTMSTNPLTFENLDEEQRADALRQQDKFEARIEVDVSRHGRSLYAGTASNGATRIIDVAVFYTQDALCSFGGTCDINAIVSTIYARFIQYTNYALWFSGVNLQLRLVATELNSVNYQFQTGDTNVICGNTLAFMNNGYIQGRREALRADVAVLVTDGFWNGCVPTNPFVQCFSPYGCFAFAYMGVTLGATPEAFAHEFGHLLGLQDPVDTNPTQPSPFDPKVCGCDSEGPVCGRSIMCGGYDVCTSFPSNPSVQPMFCLGQGNVPTGPIPPVPWYHPYSANIMNQNAKLLDDFYPGPFWHYSVTRGWFLSDFAYLPETGWYLFSSVGFAAIVVAIVMKKRRIIRSEDSSLNNHFLGNEVGKETNAQD